MARIPSSSSSDLILTITDLSRGGAGVARDESGRVIFVPLTAPGDRVKVRLVAEEKRYADAELLEILDPSPDRVPPPCPVFGKCGGCQWQHLPYELQWRTKANGVRHALSRVAVDVSVPFDEMPAQRIWNYRNRIQLRGFKNQIGFFARRSQDVVAIEACAIARSELNQALPATLAEGASRPRPYKVEVEVLPSGEVRKAWNSRHAAWGFRQVHDDQNVVLQNWVERALTPGRILLDLFGGTGNLSTPCRHKMERVYCVDVTAMEPLCRSAVRPWLESALAGGIPGLSVKSAERVPISAILDPPREGLGSDFRDIANALEKLGVTELVAVGCDPDSWARDVARFNRAGWVPGRFGAIDLFPQTPHVESVALLRRENA